jgi:ribosomal protein L29
MATTKKTTKNAAAPAVVSGAVSEVSALAGKLREFRFGAAGSRAKNTGLPKQMRKARAQLLTTANAAKKLAIATKKA